MTGTRPTAPLVDGQAIGTARLDVRGDTAIVRLVAILTDWQGQGYGRAMDGLVEACALQLGVRMLRLNAAPEAVGFYERTGWRKDVWDAEELTGIAADCVQMVRPLT